MWRYVLLILLLYLLWRFLRVLIPFVRRFLAYSEHPMEGPLSQSPPKQKYDLNKIKDAEFEELPKDTDKKNDGKQS